MSNKSEKDEKVPDSGYTSGLLMLAIEKTLRSLGINIDEGKVVLERPADFSHGDYSTSVALAYSKIAKASPKVLAEKIVTELQKSVENDKDLEFIEKIEIAGPGFINFTLNRDYYTKGVVKIATQPSDKTPIIHSPKYSGKHVLVEYTDPNAFKVFHIGHLMANAIGESISRIIASSGAKVTRMCYPSDMGLHIAKAVWATKKEMEKGNGSGASEIPSNDASIITRTEFLGRMYAFGHASYEAGKDNKDGGPFAEINEINVKLFEKSDPELNKIYKMGLDWSLEHFELLYKKLGTKFDKYIFESEVAPEGKDIVMRLAASGKVFEQSEGAYVFKGETYGLHTRVFINSHGIPTYEAKDIGLNTRKFKLMPDLEESIIVTASEQNEYFKVVKQALTLVDENIGNRTKHIGHGMLRLPTGKMSSRTGNVVTGESLIADMEALVLEKMADRDMSAEEKAHTATVIAIGAIKYSILKQAFGSDIIYDPERSISFEGDSGPYLQYACVRAKAVLAKAKESGHNTHALDVSVVGDEPATLIEKLIARYEETVERSLLEYSSHHIATYLTELAGAFNGFYANNKILDAGDATAYRIAITKAFVNIMENGLNLLGIKVPEKM